MTTASGEKDPAASAVAPVQTPGGAEKQGSGKNSRTLPLEPPEHLKKSLRALMLAQVSSNTLDIFELELFKWYVRETEGVLDQMLAGEQAYIQEQIAAGTPDLNDSGMVAADYYGKRLRYSHIIYLTSLLETCLERACTTLTTAIGKDAVPFTLDELDGDQWTRRRKFLERYGRFEIPRDRGDEVRVLIEVRNYLVHENGSTANLRDRHRDAFKKRPGINVDGYEFKIDAAYVRHGYNAVKAYVQAVEEKLREVIQRVRDTGSAS